MKRTRFKVTVFMKEDGEQLVSVDYNMLIEGMLKLFQKCHSVFIASARLFFTSETNSLKSD